MWKRGSGPAASVGTVSELGFARPVSTGPGDPSRGGALRVAGEPGSAIGIVAVLTFFQDRERQSIHGLRRGLRIYASGDSGE